MNPLPSDTAPDDLWLIVCLWQTKRTRDVALDLADRNRRAAAQPTQRKEAA